MCYLIRCGGALGGASVIALSADDALRQIDDLAVIGAFPTEILKNDERPVSLFEVRLFAASDPIRMVDPQP